MEVASTLKAYRDPSVAGVGTVKNVWMGKRGGRPKIC